MIENTDTSGCKHYTPDCNGTYRVLMRIKTSTGVIVTTFNTIPLTNNKWTLPQGGEVLRWELINS